MIEAMTRGGRRRGAAFLGVCVGMQLLADARAGVRRDRRAGLDRRRGAAHRAGRSPGQGAAHGLEQPATASLASPVFAGLRAGDHMYFTHSFALAPTNAADVAACDRSRRARSPRRWRATTSPACSSTRKSPRRAGSRLLANFLRWRAVILYPAIDLKDGQCVRVVRGDLDHGDGVQRRAPPAQAAAWADAGFAWLHVIDLNGSVDGPSGQRRGGPRDPGSAVDLPVQLGGGVRDRGRRRGAGSRRGSAASSWAPPPCAIRSW